MTVFYTVFVCFYWNCILLGYLTGMLSWLRLVDVFLYRNLFNKYTGICSLCMQNLMLLIAQYMYEFVPVSKIAFGQSLVLYTSSLHKDTFWRSSCIDCCKQYCTYFTCCQINFACIKRSKWNNYSPASNARVLRRYLRLEMFLRQSECDTVV